MLVDRIRRVISRPSATSRLGGWLSKCQGEEKGNHNRPTNHGERKASMEGGSRKVEVKVRQEEDRYLSLLASRLVATATATTSKSSNACNDDLDLGMYVCMYLCMDRCTTNNEEAHTVRDGD